MELPDGMQGCWTPTCGVHVRTGTSGSEVPDTSEIRQNAGRRHLPHGHRDRQHARPSTPRQARRESPRNHSCAEPSSVTDVATDRSASWESEWRPEQGNLERTSAARRTVIGTTEARPTERHRRFVPIAAAASSPSTSIASDSSTAARILQSTRRIRVLPNWVPRAA